MVSLENQWLLVSPSDPLAQANLSARLSASLGSSLISPSQATSFLLNTSITWMRYSQIPLTLVGRSDMSQFQTWLGPSARNRGTGLGSMGAVPCLGDGPAHGLARPGKSWRSEPSKKSSPQELIGPRSARTGAIWAAGSAANSGSLQVSRIRWRSLSLRR